MNKTPGVLLLCKTYKTKLINGEQQVAFDHATKLKQALEEAEAYIGLALRSEDRGEREIMEEIAELQIKIAERLEILAAN